MYHRRDEKRDRLAALKIKPGPPLSRVTPLAGYRINVLVANNCNLFFTKLSDVF